MARVLVVDDEEGIRKTLGLFLTAAGHDVDTAGNVAEARERITDRAFDVILSDLVMPGDDGLQLLEFVRARSPLTQFILITGEPSVKTATEALRLGAFDYLPKPVKREAACQAVAKAAREKELREENATLHEENRTNLTTQYLAQGTLDQMLRHALVGSSLEVVLTSILDDLLAIPWLGIQKKGAILLVDETTGNLGIAAQSGMSPACVEMCQSLPVGRCLCGRAVATGQVVFADELDDRHDVVCDGMAPHGHYCVPVRTSRKVVGVLTTYLDVGHVRSSEEEKFLQAVADVLAGIIERERARAAALFFRELLDRARDVILVATAATGLIVDVNEEACRRLGYTREELQRLRVTDILRGLPFPDALEQRQVELRAKGSFLTEEQEVAKDGSSVAVEACVSLVRSAESEHIVVVSRDITARKLAERDLRTAAALFEDAQEGMLITDTTGTVVQMNPAFARLTGYSRADLVGKNWLAFVSSTVDPHSKRQLDDLVRESGSWAGESPLLVKDGTEVRSWVSVTAVKKESGEAEGYVATFRDQSALKDAEEAVRQLSFLDPLTRLPNRAHVIGLLRDELVHARRFSRHLAVAHVDLNRFGLVNDLLGFVNGDNALQEAAGRLASALREGDIVARLGNDEFTVVLVDLAEPTDARRVIQGMFDRLGEPLTVGDHVLHLTASVGVAMFPLDGSEPEVLIRSAGAALKNAKQQGDNCVRFYSKDLDTDVARRLTLEAQLRQSLDRDELRLWFQPKMDLRTGRVCGMEALVRWQHPVQGLVPPSEFIPIAEETGLIIPIGQWVLDAASGALKTLQQLGYGTLPVAVNLSARQFRDVHLVERITASVEAAGVLPGRMDLEVTESMMMDDPASVVQRLRSLKERGFGLAIDDFGTGYSSLAYLKRLPIDTLKIDRSFVRDLVTDEDDAVLVTTIITLAHNLRKTVVAEGAETLEQVEFLKAHGCDAMQGYWFSRPLPFDDLVTFLRDRDVAGSAVRHAAR